MLWLCNSPRWSLERDIPDLKGKVVIVTGGNAGLGFATIQHLVRCGAKVYMAARSEERARAAIARLELGEGSVEWLELDLSEVRKAKEAAQRFLQKEKRLDILINNAAMTLTRPYEMGKDGIQDVMVINYMSPVMFTKTLLPLMRETAKEPGTDVRIVNVSSGSINSLPDDVRYRNKADFNDEHPGALFPQLKRYARSKLGNVLFTKELQRRLDEDKSSIITLTLHPGVVNTDGNLKFGQRQIWPIRPIFTWISEYLTPSPAKGAYTQVFASVAPIVREQADKYKAAFLLPPAVITNPGKPGESKELAKELWDTTENLFKELGV